MSLKPVLAILPLFISPGGLAAVRKAGFTLESGDMPLDVLVVEPRGEVIESWWARQLHPV